MKVLVALALSLNVTAVQPGRCAEAGPHSYTPSEGYVPDQQTAERIAEAVLMPIYGEQSIASERPFTARLKDGIWTVVGTMPAGYTRGGVALVEILKSDGRILRVTHGR